MPSTETILARPASMNAAHASTMPHDSKSQ